MYYQLAKACGVLLCSTVIALSLASDVHAQTTGVVEGCVIAATTGSGSATNSVDPCDGSGIPNVKVWVKRTGDPDTSAIPATTQENGYYRINFSTTTTFEVFLKNNHGDTGVTVPDAPIGFIPPGFPSNFETVVTPHVSRRYVNQRFDTGCSSKKTDPYRGGMYKGCSFAFDSQSRNETDTIYRDTNSDGIDDAQTGAENFIGGVLYTKTGAYSYVMGKTNVPVNICLDVPSFNAVKVVNGVESKTVVPSCKKVYTGNNSVFSASNWVPVGRAYSVRVPNDKTSQAEIALAGYVNGSQKVVFPNGSATNPYGVNPNGDLGYNYLSRSATAPGSGSYEGQFYGSNYIGYGHNRGCSKVPLQKTLYTEYPALLANTKTYTVIEVSTNTVPNATLSNLPTQLCNLSLDPAPNVTAAPTPTPPPAPVIKYSLSTTCTGFSIKDLVTPTTVLTALPAGSTAFVAGATTRYQIKAVGGSPSATYTAMAKTVAKDRIEFLPWNANLKSGAYLFTVTDTVTKKVILTDNTTQPDFSDCNKCDAPTGISLVFDRTGSMKKRASTTSTATYFDYEQASMREFVDTLQYEVIAKGFDNGDVQLGVVQFAANPLTGTYSDYNLNNSTETFRPTLITSAPSTNFGAVRALFTPGSPTEIKTSNQQSGGVSTCLECVINKSRKGGFSPGIVNKNMIVLSDGETNLLARMNGTTQSQKAANEFAITSYPTANTSLNPDKAYFARTGTSTSLGTFSDTNWVYTTQRTVEQAKLAKQEGIKIYAVSYNPHTLNNIAAPAGSVSTEQTMRSIASSTATFAAANDPNQWAKVMDNIAKDICAPRIATTTMVAPAQVVTVGPLNWFTQMLSNIRNTVSSFASGN